MKSFASPTAQIAVARAQSAPLRAARARGSPRARLRVVAMNILAASSDWSCSMRLRRLPRFRSRAPAQRLGDGEWAEASGTAAAARRPPALVEVRVQALAVPRGIGTRFSGFSNCRPRHVLRETAASNSAVGVRTSTRLFSFFRDRRRRLRLRARGLERMVFELTQRFERDRVARRASSFRPATPNDESSSSKVSSGRQT